MKPATELDPPVPRTASQLRDAIESERYEDALPLLQQYSAGVADLLNANKEGCGIPTREEVIELLTWAGRMLIVARGHALLQYQLLSDCQLYASQDPSPNTWQVML